MHDNSSQLICIRSFFFFSGPNTRTMRFPQQPGNTTARGRESARPKERAVRMAARRTSAPTAAWIRPRLCERPGVKPKVARSCSAAEQVQRRLREQVRKKRRRRRGFCCSLLKERSHIIASFNPRSLFYFSAANGATEAQGIVGRTPPQSAARTKSRQAKAPTQAGEFVHTHYIPLWLHLYGLGSGSLLLFQHHN